MEEVERQKLADEIANKIFSAGDEAERYGGRTKRIQFMGTNPKTLAEWAMGGFNKDALTMCIFNALTEYGTTHEATND